MLRSHAVYFPNLNGLRFIAAFMVIIYHIGQFKFIFGTNPDWETSSTALHSMGGLGVLLFFTLSGFLITYLLLEEERVTGSIDIKQFYIRRVLRIWPLYFLVFILAYFTLTHISFFDFPGYYPGKFDAAEVCLLFVFFMSNVFLAAYGIIPYASQTWSVAVEEQFYLVWPLLLKTSRNKMLSIFMVIGFIVFVRVALFLGVFDFLSFAGTLKVFWSLFSIDCMAIGGIMSVLLFRKSPFLKYFLNLPVFIFAVLALVLLVAFHIEIPIVSVYLKNDLLATLFAIVILNLAANPTLKNLLEFRWLDYLGKISYGLYMFHGIAIATSIKLLLLCNAFNDITVFMLSLLLTVLISHVSYRYFEGPFLKLKNKFSKLN